MDSPHQWPGLPGSCQPACQDLCSRSVQGLQCYRVGTHSPPPWIDGCRLEVAGVGSPSISGTSSKFTCSTCAALDALRLTCSAASLSGVNLIAVASPRQAASLMYCRTRGLTSDRHRSPVLRRSGAQGYGALAAIGILPDREATGSVRPRRRRRDKRVVSSLTLQRGKTRLNSTMLRKAQLWPNIRTSPHSGRPSTT